MDRTGWLLLAWSVVCAVAWLVLVRRAAAFRRQGASTWVRLGLGLSPFRSSTYLPGAAPYRRALVALAVVAPVGAVLLILLASGQL